MLHFKLCYSIYPSPRHRLKSSIVHLFQSVFFLSLSNIFITAALMSTREKHNICANLSIGFSWLPFSIWSEDFSLPRLGHSALHARHLERCVMRLWVCERTVHCGFCKWLSRRGSGSQSLSVGCGFSQLSLQRLCTDFLFWAQWSEKGTRFTLSFATLGEL